MMPEMLLKSYSSEAATSNPPQQDSLMMNRRENWHYF